MALQEKYGALLAYAQQNGVSGLDVQENGNVLHITGTAPSENVKQEIWKIYGQIDPNMTAGDLVLNIEAAAGSAAAAGGSYTVKSGDSLSKIAQNYPGVSWQQIFEANKDQISNPDLIQPGQVLRIP